MEVLFNYISSHFSESLIIGLLIVLFFREALIDIARSKFGVVSDEKRRILQMSNDMSALRLHFNDETTHILTDMQVTMSKQHDEFEDFGKNQLQQCAKLDEMRDILRDIQRNGVRIRT